MKNTLLLFIVVIHFFSCKKENKKPPSFKNSVETKYVTAKSGLNYRKEPRGTILGKFEYDTELEIYGHTNKFETIDDNGKKREGEWLAIKINDKIVYTFSAYLSDNKKLPKIVPKTIRKKIPEPSNRIIEKFYDAIFSNNTDLVLKMIGTEFPGNFEPKSKVTPLRAAIWQNNIQIVKKLIENNANINNKEESAIEEASEYGTYEILEYLISKKGDLNNGAFNDAKNYKCAKLLLVNGANQSIGDIRGKLRFFLEAVELNDIESIKLLKLNKDELNHNNCNGETALIIAIKKNYIELVNFLIKKGVNLEKPETFDCGDEIYEGEKPLIIAKKMNRFEIINIFANNGYD